MTALHSRQLLGVTSSPLSTPPSSETLFKQNSQSASLPQYRGVRELPFELAQHAQTYYEESLFTGALNLLLSIVSNSISASDPSLPVTIPPPSHLALAATLAVHPLLTTRTAVREKWDQANTAFRLLRLILTSVGPVKSMLSEAFKFRKYDSRSLRATRQYHDDYGQMTGKPSGRLNIRYAESDSVWSCAEDFWQTAGWAFNCSCLADAYATRWQHWQPWLEFMLDVLERDWELHYHNNTSEESLIWQYIELASGGHGRSRRMMRSIFADGSTRSLNEFRQVFRNELKAPSSKETGIKKRQVDVKVDKEVFGDYLDPDDSDLSDSEPSNIVQPNKRARTRTPSARRTNSRTSSRSSRSEGEDDLLSSSPHITTSLGPPPALRLRMRLLHLLSHVSRHPSLTSTSPTTFPDLDELYTLFVEWIKPLPLSLFQQIISTGTPSDVFSTDAHTTLCEVILQRSLESAAPAIRSEKFLTRDKLVEQYLPFAAAGASVAEQAKVSLLLEALLRRSLPLFAAQGKEAVIVEQVMEAIELGRDKREGIAREWMAARRKKRRRKNATATTATTTSKASEEDEENEEKEAWKWLRESGMRMKIVVELLE